MSSNIFHDLLYRLLIRLAPPRRGNHTKVAIVNAPAGCLEDVICQIARPRNTVGIMKVVTVRGLLFDMDGVLYNDSVPIEHLVRCAAMYAAYPSPPLACASAIVPPYGHPPAF